MFGFHVVLNLFVYERRSGRGTTTYWFCRSHTTRTDFHLNDRSGLHLIQAASGTEMIASALIHPSCRRTPVMSTNDPTVETPGTLVHSLSPSAPHLQDTVTSCLLLPQGATWLVNNAAAMPSLGSTQTATQQDLLHLLSNQSSDQGDVVPPSLMPDSESVQCNCRKSQCLKKYCCCFAVNVPCKNCNCIDCQNTVEHMGHRTKAMQHHLVRTTRSFSSKLKVSPADPTAEGSSIKTQHAQGCNCKRHPLVPNIVGCKCV